MASNNPAWQGIPFFRTEEEPAGKTEVSLQIRHVDEFVKMKEALKTMHSGDDSDFETVLRDVLEDVDVKKDGMSTGKYTTIKSVTSGVLNIGLLELTILAMKELVQAGKDTEPFYDTLFGIYITMIVLQTIGIVSLAWLAKTDFKTVRKDIWYHHLNGAIAAFASILLILGTVAATLKADKNSVSIDKFIEKLKEANVTINIDHITDILN